LDSERIIESHGSFHHSYCVGTSEKESCGSVYTQAWYKERLFNGENPILCPKCQGYVKPGVIFFGEDLPSKFFNSLRDDIPKCDLLLILGTSLKVSQALIYIYLLFFIFYTFIFNFILYIIFF